MTKKKKILNGIIFLAGLIVFVIYYFKDNTDLEKVEKAQDESAQEAADNPETGLDAISEDVAEFEDGNFEVAPAADVDSAIVDSL